VTSFAAVLIAAAAQQYVVTAGEGARELSIEAQIPAFPIATAS